MNLKEIFDPDWQALFIRFVFNMVMVQILTRLLYYRKGRKKRTAVLFSFHLRTYFHHLPDPKPGTG